MMRVRFLLFTAALLAVGYGLESRSLSYREPTAVSAGPHADGPRDGTRRGAIRVGERLSIDVSELLARLDDLRPDERSEQIADWAVYGTLMQSGLSSDALRQATFDTLPIRLPAFEEVVDFDYGRGRRVSLPDGGVWLFYSERDDQAEATIARLADQVRMERGQAPTSFAVFRYRSALVEGTISVERQEDISAERLFSPEYGYVEGRVATAPELAEWLSRVDDVTHVVGVSGGALQLGGRRFAAARTAGIDLDDVAVLYQAHRRLAAVSKKVQEALEEASTPLTDAFGNMIDAYNANVDLYNVNNHAPLDAGRFRNAVAALSALLGSEMPGGDYTQIRAEKAIVGSLRLEVEPRVDELQRNRFKELRLSGVIPPDAPGFSLDPQWDVKGLVEDLNLLLTRPAVIIADAEDVLDTADYDPDDDSARPRPVTTALDVENVFGDSDYRQYRVPAKWRPVIEDIVSSVRGQSGVQVERRAIVPFLRLQEELKHLKGSDAERLLALLEHIESQHRTQCARYDGDIKGTRVGMNLFYTDLLAKLWASVDYYRQAPIAYVPGFRSSPIDGPSLEPLYWDEQWRFPSTRLWFGPKGEAYKGQPDLSGGLNFAHVSTRVYAAGSNPLLPGDETTPNEGSRRVFGWWDRHYAQVADYEQAYHLQNQIMKWSVITGWLAKNGSLSDLDDLHPNRTYRFDRWFTAADDLKFREFVPFLPQNRWLGGTECVEILRSYMFPSAGSAWTYIEGGVSLGSSRSLGAASRITDEVPLSLRRAAIDYSASEESGLTNLRGTLFKLPRAETEGASVVAQLRDSARLRMGAAEISAKTLTTEIGEEHGAARIAVRLEGGSMGALRAEPISSGVRLAWTPGSVESDQAVLARVADGVSGERAAAAALASDPRLLPARKTYVIELDNGRAEALRVAGGSGGGGGEPPSSLRVGPADEEPGGHPYLRTTDDGSYWAVFAKLGYDVRGDRALADAVVLDVADANARLNGMPWQRLRALPEGPSDSAGVVERIFTTKGPDPDAHAVVLHTQDASLGDLHGVVDKGALYVRRPSDPALQQRFNDLVVDEGISGGYVRGAVAAVRSTSGVTTLEPAQSPEALCGVRAAAHASEGDYGAALKEFHAAADGGKLHAAIESYRHQVQSLIAQGLRDGNVSPAAARFAGSGSHVDDPNTALVAALDALRRRRPQDAAGLIQQAVDTGAVPDDTVAGVRTSFRELGSEPVADFISARGSGKIPPEVAAGIKLEVVGARLHTTLNADSLSGGRRLSEAERLNLAAMFRRNAPADVYPEDGQLLNKFDWDAMPGATLSEIALDPDISVEALNAEQMGGFRPSLLLEANKRFVRQTVDRSGTRKERPLPARATIYVLHSCDADDDGQITAEERRRCAA